jgi:hypothetical protein
MNTRQGGKKDETDKAICAERTAATFCRSRSAVRSAVAAHRIIHIRM